MSIKYNNKDYNLYRVGKLLKSERKRQGLNLDDLQEKTKIVKSRLSYLENAKIKSPSIDHFLKIIDALKINDSDIFNEYSEEKDMEEQTFLIHFTSIRSKLQIGEYEAARKEINIIKSQLGNNSRYVPYILKLYGDYYYNIKSYQHSLNKYKETSNLLESNSLQNSLYFDTQISLNNTLYQMRKPTEALHYNISLLKKLQTISQKRTKTENYARYMVRVYFNISLCYIEIFEFDRAHEILQQALALTRSINDPIEAVYSYFMAIILYYKGDIKESHQYFAQAITDIQKKNDPKLIAKSITAMHTFGFLEPDYFGLRFTSGDNEFYYECDDICKKEKSFHRAINEVLKDYIIKGKDAEAISIIQKMEKYGHTNTMTTFHHAMLLSKTNPDFAEEKLNQIMEVIEYDADLYAYEKSYIISTYLKSQQKHDKLHSTLHKQLEEVYLSKYNELILELLPEPIN